MKNEKNANSQQNRAVFSAAKDSEKKSIQMIHRKGQIKSWTELSSFGQEPTFKVHVHTFYGENKTIYLMSHLRLTFVMVAHFILVVPSHE